MDKQLVERRMATMMGHFAGNEETTSNHIFLMNCSSTLNSVIRRCDNRTFFARQSSLSQGPYMRQKLGEDSYLQQGLTLNYAGPKNQPPSIEQHGKPVFSRPAQPQTTAPTMSDEQMKQVPTEAPMFARPKSKQISQPRVTKICRPCGTEWSPRMDVAESRSNYAVTIELPGVSINDVRVEVDEKNLIVTGKRSSQRWRASNFAEHSDTMYLRKEISQGPYEVVWPLPHDVNKDRVSAEFVDGFLQINLPKF